jgi:hypothetical protein
MMIGSHDYWDESFKNELKVDNSELDDHGENMMQFAATEEDTDAHVEMQKQLQARQEQERQEEELELERLERERRLFSAVNLTMKWKRLFDRGEHNFANRDFCNAYFAYHDAIRVLESIDVEWLGFVETLAKAGHCSLKMAMVRISHCYNDEDDFDQEYYDDALGNQFAEFKEAEDCFKRSLTMLSRMDYFEDDYARKIDLRKEILLALQKVLRIRRDHGFLYSTEEVSAKEIELAKITEELRFFPKSREGQKLEPLEESFFNALSSVFDTVKGSYEFVDWVKPTNDIMERLSEQIRSVYGNDSLQAANVLENLADSIPYADRDKRLEFSREILRIRIKHTGFNNASVAKSIRSLALLYYSESRVLHDALNEYAKNIEKLLKTRSSNNAQQSDDSERYDWQKERYIEEYLVHTGLQQHDVTFDEAAKAVKKWLNKQAVAYLNELGIERSTRRAKRLNETQQYKKLAAMINQALSISRIVDAEQRHPKDTVTLLSLLSETYKRLDDNERAQQIHHEKLGIIATHWGPDHAVMKEVLTAKDR